MAQKQPAAPGPDRAAQLATMPARFDRSGLLLLGTFGTTEAPGALLRLPDGTVRRVAPGDTVDGANVLAIADGTLVLARGGTASTLQPPSARPAAMHRGNVR